MISYLFVQLLKLYSGLVTTGSNGIIFIYLYSICKKTKSSICEYSKRNGLTLENMRIHLLTDS